MGSIIKTDPTTRLMIENKEFGHSILRVMFPHYFILTDDEGCVMNWIIDNLSYAWYFVVLNPENRYAFYFASPNDATLFKLRFL